MFRRPDPVLAEKTPQPACAPPVLRHSSDRRPHRLYRDFRMRRIFSTENTPGDINSLCHGNRVRQQLAVCHDHADGYSVGHRAASWHWAQQSNAWTRFIDSGNPKYRRDQLAQILGLNFGLLRAAGSNPEWENARLAMTLALCTTMRGVEIKICVGGMLIYSARASP